MKKEFIQTIKDCWLVIVAILVFPAVAFLQGCSDAEMASRNLSRAAMEFEIDRRIVFYNGITGEYMLVINGRCSVDHKSAQLAVTCKTGPEQYKKHYLGLSDNVTYFSEQVEAAKADIYHYRVIFKPEAILPNFELDTSR